MPLLYDIDLKQDYCQTVANLGYSLQIIKPDDTIPESFFQGLEDCEQGRTIDMEIALNDSPPDDL
jgi:hypothetical protein